MAATPVSVKRAVQTRASAMTATIAGADPAGWEAFRSAEFAQRDGDLPPLFARVARAELIGTVANRTLIHVHLDGGDTRVVELLWRDHDGTWLVDDARVFSLLPDEG